MVVRVARQAGLSNAMSVTVATDSPLVEQAYAFWAGWRLRLTGRPSLDQLCQQRCRLPE